MAVIRDRSIGETIFTVVNIVFLSIVAGLCLFPMIHVLALSFSDASAAARGEVTFYPVSFTLTSYRHILRNAQFIRSFGVSLLRIVVGVPLNIGLISLVAYPLSKEPRAFPGRTAFAWIFVITMLFNGGLIPTYMTVKMTGIMDTIWALVLPTAVPVFSMVILLNFFRGVPKELEDAASMDGANHWRVLLSIYLPLSLPSLATVTLFQIVFHWNSWFDGLIYMNSAQNYPLQTYLQTIMIETSSVISQINDPELLRTMMQISERTGRAAQIFIAMVPVLAVYPFLQRYFLTGLVLGSVKG